MEHRGAPPVPHRLAKAVMMYVTGMTSPMPVKASRPTDSIWPMNARSTTLYRTTVSCATVSGMARDRIFWGMLPREKSFFCCASISTLHFVFYHCRRSTGKLQAVFFHKLFPCGKAVNTPAPKRRYVNFLPQSYFFTNYMDYLSVFILFYPLSKFLITPHYHRATSPGVPCSPCNSTIHNATD